nr:iron uptake porin [Oculatellaceae cyanobacterium Prado106]
MVKILWSMLLATPAIFSAIAISSPAIASEIQSVSDSSQSINALRQLPEEQISEDQVIDEQFVEAQAVEVQAVTPEAVTDEQAPTSSVAQLAQMTQAVPDAIPSTTPEPSTAQSLESTPAVPTSSIDSLTQVMQYSNEEVHLAQGSGLTIDQLTDVRPTDWAYTALQRLVEEYGCIVGYPDRTYRGNRALTRYEFAAGLNACLDRISTLIAESTADLASKEDLAILQRLQEEFAAELATLRGRVDSLEARTAELEANQFSTTTRLNGETIFAVSDIFGGGTDDVENDLGDINQTTFQYRVRLNFDTSFFGSDRLRARLQAGNFNRFITSDPASGTSLLGNEGRLGFDTNTDGDLEIDTLSYRFPVGSRVTAQVLANSGDLYEIAPTITPFSSSGSGALSRFGRFNPIYRVPENNAGAGATFKFSDEIALSLGYLAGEPGRSNSGAGLFNGSYGAIGQLTFTPFNQLSLGLTYVGCKLKKMVTLYTYDEIINRTICSKSGQAYCHHS